MILANPQAFSDSASSDLELTMLSVSIPRAIAAIQALFSATDA
jgi:hypothetical protein